jgi:hypothetical protein
MDVGGKAHVRDPMRRRELADGPRRLTTMSPAHGLLRPGGDAVGMLRVVVHRDSARLALHSAVERALTDLAGAHDRFLLNSLDVLRSAGPRNGVLQAQTPLRSPRKGPRRGVLVFMVGLSERVCNRCFTISVAARGSSVVTTSYRGIESQASEAETADRNRLVCRHPAAFVRLADIPRKSLDAFDFGLPSPRRTRGIGRSYRVEDRKKVRAS